MILFHYPPFFISQIYKRPLPLPECFRSAPSPKGEQLSIRSDISMQVVSNNKNRSKTTQNVDRDRTITRNAGDAMEQKSNNSSARSRPEPIFSRILHLDIRLLSRTRRWWLPARSIQPIHLTNRAPIRALTGQFQPCDILARIRRIATVTLLARHRAPVMKRSVEIEECGCRICEVVVTTEQGVGRRVWV